MDDPKPKRPGRTDATRVEHSVMLDPRDVHRYRRREGERKRKGAAKLRVAAAIVAVLAVFVGVYVGFDSLRDLVAGTEAIPLPAHEPAAAETPAPAAEATRPPARQEAAAPARREPPAREEAPAAVAETPAPSAPPADAPPDASAGADAPAEAVADASAEAGAEAAADTPPEPPPPPPPPPEPERYEFGLAVNNVSEGDAAAAVLLMRYGGTRGAASVVWWTTPGTASAGVDYADLGRVTAQFPRGAQNITLRIPIVGDRVAEGSESFYVHFALRDGADAGAEPTPTEVVIYDDD